MNNIIDDEYVKKILMPNGIVISHYTNEKYINKHNPNILTYMYKRYDDIDEQTTISEILYRICNNINEIPKCPVCGKRLPFKSGYGTFCSRKCKYSDKGKLYWKEQITSTMKEKYGVEHALQSNKFKNKLEQNNFKKYGVKNVFQTCEVKNKIINTNLKKYGVDRAQKSDEIRNKIRDTVNEKYYSGTEDANKLKEIKSQKVEETMMKHYGVKHALQNKDIMQNLINYNIEKYGVACVLSNKEVREKGYKTIYQKYGVRNPAQSDIIKQQMKNTCLEKYGTEYACQSDIVKDKIKYTCLERYGVEYIMQSDIFKEKSKETCLTKYGVDNIGKSEEIRQKIKETNLERYGCEYPQQNEEIKQKMKDAYYEKYLSGTKEANENWNNVLEKKKKTYIEKYGSVKNYYQVTYDKIVRSLQKHKNHGMTTPEYQTYEYLQTIFDKDDIQFNSKIDERYPFHVDFYIKPLDLFIEINAFWTHGKHLFDEDNKDDIDLLNKWKQKAETSKQYKSAVNVWSVIDPFKCQTAKMNNLNYLPIWSNKIEIIKTIINEYLENNKRECI